MSLLKTMGIFEVAYYIIKWPASSYYHISILLFLFCSIGGGIENQGLAHTRQTFTIELHSSPVLFYFGRIYVCVGYMCGAMDVSVYTNTHSYLPLSLCTTISLSLGLSLLGVHLFSISWGWGYRHSRDLGQIFPWVLESSSGLQPWQQAFLPTQSFPSLLFFDWRITHM